MNEEIEYYLEQLRKGNDVFFDLIEIDDAFVPELIDTYWQESNSRIRVDLVEAIWQHRLPDTLSFLSEVLQDDDAEIWKEALDGIVAINAEEGIQVLAAEKERLLSLKQEARLEWIEEALTQLRENLLNL